MERVLNDPHTELRLRTELKLLLKRSELLYSVQQLELSAVFPTN